MSSSSAIPPNLLLKDRYRIEKEIGRGGFGAVYLARDEQLVSRRVVVKVLLDEASRDPWLQKKFRQEIEALARIDHPGVVGALDVGETPQGNPFLVMQLVEGVTLRSLIRGEGMELGRVAHIMRQAGQALSAAHEKGVYHRDLKPENIMLQDLGEGAEQVKLIDFGIAAIRDSQVAAGGQTSRIAGSLAYMAPEQLVGKAAPSSDIYALGLVAYEMITGRRPEMTPQGVQAKPSELRPGVPEAAEVAILKALAFHPEQRYARPRDFGEDLARALTGTASATAPAPRQETTQPSLEMAYVLFTDLVSYSTFSMDKQTRMITELGEIIRGTAQFQQAQAAQQLISLPTGDGMALVFFQNPVAAVQCAVEVARALRSRPDLRLRMGVHTGPVHRIADINTNRNVTGGGINLAQRVMDCGDAGHILLSKAVADVLGQVGDWAGHLHDLGEHEVKHGVKVHLVNLCTADAGNPEMPAKLRARAAAAPPAVRAAAKSRRGLYMMAGAALTIVILVVAGIQVANWRQTKAGGAPPTSGAPPSRPPEAPPPAPVSVVPSPTPAPVSPPAAKPQQQQAPRQVREIPASPGPKATEQARPQTVPAQQAPAAAQIPVQPAAAASSPAEKAAMEELRERMIFLAARAGTVRNAMENLERQQQRSGLTMRADMAAARQRFEYLMGEANAAMGKGDPAATKRNLDLAERDIEKLERFLGK